MGDGGSLFRLLPVELRLKLLSHVQDLGFQLVQNLLIAVKGDWDIYHEVLEIYYQVHYFKLNIRALRDLGDEEKIPDYLLPRIRRVSLHYESEILGKVGYSKNLRTIAGINRLRKMTNVECVSIVIKHTHTQRKITSLIIFFEIFPRLQKVELKHPEWLRDLAKYVEGFSPGTELSVKRVEYPPGRTCRTPARPDKFAHVRTSLLPEGYLTTVFYVEGMKSPIEISWETQNGQHWVHRERPQPKIVRKVTMTDKKYLEEEHERQIEILSDLNRGIGVADELQAKELAAARESGRMICRKCDRIFPSRNKLHEHIRLMRHG